MTFQGVVRVGLGLNVPRRWLVSTRHASNSAHAQCGLVSNNFTAFYSGIASLRRSFTTSSPPTAATSGSDTSHPPLAPESPPILAGTSPTHRLYILIHHPLPPWLYPPKLNDTNISFHLERDRRQTTFRLASEGMKVSTSRISRAESAAKLLRELQVRVARMGGLVNFMWVGEMEEGRLEHASSSSAPEGMEDTFRVTAFIASKSSNANSVPLAREVVVHGDSVLDTLGAGCTRLVSPNISPSSAVQLDKLASTLQTRLAHTDDGAEAEHDQLMINSSISVESKLASKESKLQSESESETKQLILVCTHDARDCRCGTTGRDVADALRREVWRRASEGEEVRWKVCEVGHVGGHKYAANVLVYPPGDWYGLLTPDSVPTLFDMLSANYRGPESITASARSKSKSKSLGHSHSDFLLSHWRGRIGLDKATAHEVYEKFKIDRTEEPEKGGLHDASVNGTETLELRPRRRAGSASGR